MAYRKEVEEVSLSDLLNMASSGLTAVSTLPNMHMYIPHDKQEMLHRSLAKEKIFLGGNRSGKTVWNIMECIWWLTKKHPFRPDVNEIVEPIRGRLVCVDFVSALEMVILPYFKQFLPETEMRGGDWEKAYKKSTRTLTLENGSTIEFMSYDQDTDAFAGASRHFISYDEEPPQAIFTECQMRLVDTDGSFWMSMTPVEGMTWVYYELYEPWKEGNDPGLQILEINTDENKYIKSGALDRITRRLSADDKATRKEGSFVQSSGLVFPEFNPNIHKRHQFKLTRDMVVYTSFDHGWRHPAAWLWHAVLPNDHIVTFHEIVVSNHTVSELAAMVKEYERQAIAPVGLQVVARPADPATAQTSGINGMSIMQTYALEGIFLSTEGIPKGPNSVSVGIDKMHEYLKIDDITGTPFWEYYDCKTFERQMKNLRYDKFTSKKLQYDSAPKLTINKREDDAPDSARYFFTLRPNLYIKDGDKEVRAPSRNIGGLSAVEGQTPWNSRVRDFSTNGESEYTIYEGSGIYDMENY